MTLCKPLLQIRRVCFAILGGMLFCANAQAADIQLLDVNPVFGPDYTLLDFGDNNAIDPDWAGDQNFKYSASQPTSEQSYRTPKSEGWNEEDGMYIGEGGGSYSMFHLQMTWPTLQKSRVIKISGQIERGDADRLKQLVDQTGFSVCSKPNQCPSNNTISLDSPGGSLLEAIKIGRYIAEHNFSTLVEKNATCESACTLAFLGGYTAYEGFFFPRRYVHETARLGVHRPYFRLPDQTYTGAEVENVVQVVNKSVTIAMEYLLTVGVSASFLQRMYETPPESMHYLSPLELSTQRIFVVGRDQALTTLTRRQFFAYCATVYEREYANQNPFLLSNLQSNAAAFITFVPGNDFICSAAKRLATGTWYAQVCVEDDCGVWRSGLAYFGQVEMGYFSESPSEAVWGVGVAVDVLGPGAGYREYRHRSALLKYVRAFVDGTNFGGFRELPASVASLPVPQDYCGEIDGFDPGLVLEVQRGLNANGIDVGKPDGAAGPNTRKGIRTYNRKTFGKDSEKIDEDLLVSLGFEQQKIDRSRLCP